jgi:hypothetical protein
MDTKGQPNSLQSTKRRRNIRCRWRIKLKLLTTTSLHVCSQQRRQSNVTMSQVAQKSGGGEHGKNLEAGTTSQQRQHTSTNDPNGNNHDQLPKHGYIRDTQQPAILEKLCEEEKTTGNQLRKGRSCDMNFYWNQPRLQPVTMIIPSKHQSTSWHT